MVKLLTLMTQMFTTSAAVLVFMANEYQVMGFGLNPYLALPLATLFMVAPYFIDHWFIEIDPGSPDELSTITVNPKAFRSVDEINADTARLDEETKRLNEDTARLNRETTELLEKRHMGDPDKKTGIYHPDRQRNKLLNPSMTDNYSKTVQQATKPLDAPGRAAQLARCQSNTIDWDEVDANISRINADAQARSEARLRSEKYHIE
jgi:hypothetical protein